MIYTIYKCILSEVCLMCTFLILKITFKNLIVA